MNIADLLVENARKWPNKDAIRFPIAKRDGTYTYDSISFYELDKRSTQFALGLKKMGVKKGDKTLLFVKPSLDFAALTFALFKLGVVPVLIDPGMGKDNLLKAIESTAPTCLIGIPKVHILRLFFRKPFKSINKFITTGKLTWGGMKTTSWMKSLNVKEFSTEKVNEEDLAAILFTSGGTGIPKGVLYTHKIFSTQTQILKSLFNLSEDDVDIPGFPLFSLFTVAMGMTSCIPDMDPSKPGKADPKKLIKNIMDNKATFVAGSPAIWKEMATYCVKNKITLPSVKNLVMFGAPISVEMHEQFSKVLVNGTTNTPYGATESLPIANITGKEVLSKTAELSRKGKGTCVGKAAPGIEIKIINITDDIISNIEEAKIQEIGIVGEILVKGDVVTKSYYKMIEKTKEAKIQDGETFWHRMGDLGYLDIDGNLWFCGRKTHRVESKEGLLTSIPCEAIFNNHPEINKSALIGIGEFGSMHPALVIERKDKKELKGDDKKTFEKELNDLAAKHDHTKLISTYYYQNEFPVDIRHNIKIDRLLLRDKAARGEL
jgi:acyl-CoA synthetase (AMP-forming)/AMP-acid ligase II